MSEAVASDPQPPPLPTDKIPHSAAGPCRVIEHHFRGFSPSVVFDVGANVGYSAAAFHVAFPEAAIYAFEPAISSFRTLQANLADRSRLNAFNMALGRRSGPAHVTARPTSPSNRIVESPDVFQRRKTEPVAMASGDDFAAEHGVQQIGFLKVDAEGHDLDVLIGFQRMLTDRRVDIIETEVGMNRENRRHVPFEAVKAYLEPLGYRLFHIHDLAMDTPFSGRVMLRRVNAMFASVDFLDANRVDPKRRPKGQPAA